MPNAIAITSGKGGVGKSAIALNLAVALARRDRRTLLIDADFGLGSIALLMGSAAENGIEDVLLGHCRAVDAAIAGPEGLTVLATVGGAGMSWPLVADAELIGEDLRTFEAEFDTVIVDTGAGLSAKTVDSVIAAERALLVATPEPAAIADAYATLKTLLGQFPQLDVHLLVNMAESQREADDLQVKFGELSSRFLGAQIDNRGYIPLDRYVREAAKRQVPFAQMDPPSPAAEAIEELAEWLFGFSRRESGFGFFDRVLGQR